MGPKVMHGMGTALLVVAGLALAIQGYIENFAAQFFVGVLTAALTLGPLTWFGLRDWLPLHARRAAAMISIYLITLLGIEAGWRIQSALHTEPPLPAFYNYQTAREDPNGFRRWWSANVERFLNQFDEFAMKDPSGLNPYVLIPNHDHKTFESKIHVNALGFRGREIERTKGNRFRIVAIGESTTWGLTFQPEDRTWPELLEKWIAERFQCARPVEVINAGMPGWTLANQIKRFGNDIWPLKPDLLLSYHGYNGFDWFFFGLDSVNAIAPPLLPERPSWILGGLERTVLLSSFRSRYNKQREGADPLAGVALLNNPYGRLYQRLIQVSRAHDTKVVISTFNMAVNGESPEEVVRFYEFTVPDVRMRIRANELHNRMVLSLSDRPGVQVIDTGPGVDGAYLDGYVDLAHMTQQGRERFAESLLAGLETSIGAGTRADCVRKR